MRDLDIAEQKDWIEIPNDIELWLVDGQHRVEGLREVVDEYPRIRNLELPIIISNFRNKYDEAKQFLIINKTQKGVRPDLAERILQKVVEKEGMEKIIQERGRGYLKAIFRDIEWQTKAIEVVDKLNSIKDSPFYKRVRYPNTPKITTVVREISLTDSLQPIFKDDLLGELPVDLLAKALVNYWKVIKDMCPEAFEAPYEYVIQRTTGVFSLHQLFPTVARYCRDENGRFDLREETIHRVLKLAQDRFFNSSYWHSQGGAGMMGTNRKACAAIAGLIRDEIVGKSEGKEMGVSAVLV